MFLSFHTDSEDQIERLINDTGTVTFEWSTDVLAPQTCCWSITNLRFIESNDSGQTESKSRSIETCVTGGNSAYKCDGETWLCTQAFSNGIIPPITKLTSDSYQLENLFNNFDVQRNCTTINFMSQSQSPPSLLPCYIEPSRNSITITSSSNLPTTFSSMMRTSNIQLTIHNTLPTVLSSPSTPVNITHQKASTSISAPSITRSSSGVPSKVFPSQTLLPIPSVATNCEQEGIWHQTSEDRNATVVGACYNGTANGMYMV